MAQPGVGDGSVLIGDDDLRCLLDHGIEVVDGFLVLAKLEVSRRPSEPGVEIAGLRLEGGFRRLQSRGGTLLRAGRRRCRSEIEVDQGARLLTTTPGGPLPTDRLDEAVSEVPVAVLCQTPE